MRWRPARSASSRPVADEPVKLMQRTSGRSKNSSATGAAAPGRASGIGRELGPTAISAYQQFKSIYT